MHSRFFFRTSCALVFGLSCPLVGATAYGVAAPAAKKPAAKTGAKKPLKQTAPRVVPADDSWVDWQNEAAQADAPAAPKKDVVKAEAFSGDLPPAVTKTSAKAAMPAPRLTEIPTYLVSARSAETAQLAQNGRALMPIVVAADASEGVKALAEEVRGYLSRIAGAEFKVETGDGKSGIVLGTLAQFPDAALNKPLEIRGVNGREAFAIRTSQKGVRLIAAEERGIPYAAYRFLELLGVRWFFPAKHWEVVPSQANLTFNTDQSDRPVLLNRSIWASWGFFGDTPDKRWNREPGNSRSATDYVLWGRHNLQGGSMQVNTGHAWQDIIKINNEEFVKHPEYYAMVGGKRPASWESKFEISNPGVRKLVVDYALNYFKNNPTADMVSVDPSDGGGHSESPEAQALGSISDQVFGLANEVAREVQKKYPGKMVGLLAYNYHAMPPTFALEPNVYVQMPTAFIQGKYTLDDLIELWPQKAKSMGFYDYYSVWLWRRDFLPGGTAANAPAMQPGIQNFVKHGGTSISAESGNDWGLSGRGYYLGAKLMWDPNADVEAISKDFYQKAFGAGAAAMQRYYERVEGANKARLSRNTYALALRDVDEAGRAAANDPASTARIDDIKQYLRYQHLNWEWERVNITTAITPEKEKAWNDRIEQTFRERFSYMTHFAAQLANGYADWDHIAKHPEMFPDKPYSRAERDAQWREMLATYKPLELHERDFSAELVAARLPGPAVETRQHFAGRAGFRFASKGEPIEITIQTDALPGFEGRPDARYTFEDINGKVVARGRMQIDGKANTLKWDVPAGTYALDFDGAQGSWTLIAPPNRAVTTMLLKQWPRNQMAPVQDMYFYVPKGTRQIELATTSPLKVADPSGTEAAPKASYDDTVIYEVPVGMDGKAWKLPQFALGHLWFHNVPNHIAASPGALLVPRDVAQSDGLGGR